MDRFSLLLLEPGEIYFEDFAVKLYKNPEEKAINRNKNREIEEEQGPIVGRLKICSKSLVFVPSASVSPSGDSIGLHRPLIKFPLCECGEIKEWFPKSFQSPLAKESHGLISVRATSFVEMLSGNLIAPFNFVRREILYVFALRYSGTLCDHLLQICQLHRASTLPPVEQNGMIAAIVYSRQSRLTFDSCWLENVKEDILLKTVGNKVTPLVVNPGRIVLTDAMLYFQPYNNAESNPVIKIKLSSIRRIYQRRYLLRPMGLEIDYFDRRGKREHIYLTFNKPEDRQRLYHKMIAQKNLQLEDIREDNMTLQWQKGRISNFDYLLYLNNLADRSFNDLTQYPVFPWVVADYTSDKLDLTSPLTFRDLSKPMGALDPERLASLKHRSQDLPDPKFLYGSHYSTPGFVLYFLVRKIPECMLCLQNGRFDHPDRMFNSVPQTWINVTTHHSDFKELVPQFYMPENQGDFLRNLFNINFGVRQCGRPVGEVELPPWAEGSPAKFVSLLRDALESDYVSENLHGWIDLIFGYKQRGKEAQDADNLFYHLCYEGSVDLDTITDLEERYALEVQIGEFGQVPKQIFTSPHPQKQKVPSSSKKGNNGGGNDSVDAEENGTVVPTISTVDDDSAGVKLWKDMSLLKRVCDYQVHRESLSSVAISVDNLWVFSASHDAILKMYSLEEKQVLRSITVSTMTISTLLPLPNNKTILLGSKDNNLCAYSIEYSRTSDYLPVHSDAISCMDWRAGVLATGSWDSSVKLWQCSEVNGYKVRLEKDLLATLEHTSQVTCLHLCSDNSQLVVGTRDGLVFRWCLLSHKVIQELSAHTRQVQAIRFSPDNKWIISCGSDFMLKVIDIKTGTVCFSKNFGEELNCLSWDGQSALIGGGSGSLILFDLIKGEQRLKIPAAHKGPVTAVCVSADGDLVVTGGEDRRVVVWSAKTDQEDEI